jgi:exosortase K
VKTKLLVLAVAALVVWGLKRHYADARADELEWILSPTATLVAGVTGTPFVRAPGEGYVSHERLFVIEKSCAGINFMAAAFVMLVFTLLRRVRSAAAVACMLIGSLAAAYVAAVLVNAARIAVALWLGVHPVALTALSAGDAHRLEGIVVYFAGLVLLYELARRFDWSTASSRRYRQ